MDAHTANDLRVLGDVHRLALLEAFEDHPSSVRNAGIRASTHPINPAYHVDVLARAGFVAFQEETRINNSRARIFAITHKGQRGLELARSWQKQSAGA